MKKISYFFLFILVFSVYAEKEKLPFISKAAELKTIKGKKIIWQKDGAKMVIVRPYRPSNYKEEKTSNQLGEPITKKAKVSPQDIYTNLDSSSFLSGLDSASLQDFVNDEMPAKHK